MTRLCWLTDVHLNFPSAGVVSEFFERVADCQADAVLLGGDISESADLLSMLRHMSEAIPAPIYFVLGNHDYYFSSIERVRSQVRKLCSEMPNLHWLGDLPAVELSPNLALVGDDGWGDGRFGDYERSLVMMNDYRLIEDFAGMGKLERWPILKQLGDRAGQHIRETLPTALETHEQAILLTHVPPFREACWYQGQISNDEWLPHFTCKAMGDAARDVMRAHPNRRLTVLCGHTHSGGEAWPTPNIHVLTGEAEYGNPTIQQVLEFE